MNLDDTQEIPARHDRITANAAARARLVMATINDLRVNLLKCPEHEERSKIAILQSFDAELTRLCQIPGVAQALFDEGAV